MSVEPPDAYWSNRLSREFSLRGTGHIAYSEGYNAWMYRAKGRALRRALRRARPTPDALDVGVGTGWCLGVLESMDARVDGCDIVEQSIQRASEQFPEGSFFQLDISTDPIPKEAASYDLVTALDVLYHVVDDEGWERALREFARVLKPGGVLIATDGLGSVDRHPAAHVHFRSHEHWASGAALAGFDLTELRPLYRWLSRDPGRERRFMPDAVRGAVEYALETLAPRRPHMHCVVLTRHASPRRSAPAA